MARAYLNIAAALGLAFALSASAFAQEPAPPPAESTAPAAETPQLFTTEQAEALLAATNASSYFDIESDEGGATMLRHRASGMLCRFSPRDRNRVNILRPGNADSDVGCVTGPWPSTLIAVIKTRRMSPEVMIRAAEEQFREDHPGAREFRPGSGDWPESTRNVRIIHLMSNAGGETHVFHAAAVRRGQWTVIYRYTYGSTGDLGTMAAEILACAQFNVVVQDMTR